MGEIVVEDVRADGSTLRSTVSVSGGLRRYFRDEELLVEYSDPIEGVPASILSIPVLAQVCPIAWTRGADVHVPTVDREFGSALRDLQETFVATYPEFMREGGRIHGDHVRTDAPPAESGQSAQLFTGGVDSMATYLRNREEAPAFVSINGWTEPVNDPDWPRRKEVLRGFSDHFGLDHHFLRSNMLSLLDHTMLIAEYKRYLLGSWYSAVGHGVGLLGLCAPLAYANGFERIYVAATYCEEYNHRWGSSPEIVDDVRWTGTRAIHDGFELTRQEKLEQIASFAADEWQNMPLDTCNAEVGSNCGRCEKCIRTAVGLVLTGRDPNEHGYRLDSSTFEYAREQLERGEWEMDELGALWSDIQRHVDLDVNFPVEGAEPFLRWLQSIDFESVEAEYSTPRRDRFLRFLVRNVPYSIYERLYPRYASIANAK